MSFCLSFMPCCTGGVIMLLGFWLFDSQLIHVVSITFTALILTELLMVALTIRTWHLVMIISELITIAIYVSSLVLLKDYFGKYIIILISPSFYFLYRWQVFTVLWFCVEDHVDHSSELPSIVIF